MKNYEEFTDGLSKDIKVPQGVWNKVEDTLSSLPEMENKKVIRGTNWMKVVVSTAAALALVVGVLYSNPVLASKIPFVGKIFERVGNDVTFSGDFQGKGLVLTEDTDQGEIKDKEKQAENNSVYTVRDQGIEVTASEIYCDGYSVFLTAQIQVDEGGLTNMSEHFTSAYGENLAHGMYTSGDWSIVDQADMLINNNFEGKVIDDHTYIGMMKINLEDYTEQDGVLDIQFSQLGYDDVNADMGDDISITNLTDGSWNLSVPYEVDIENTKLITVNEQEDGYGIHQAFISPYQVIIGCDIPSSTLNPEEFSREDFERLWGDQIQDAESGLEQAFTYEDYLAQEIQEPFEIAAFNQDGTVIELAERVEDRFVFAVKGIDISRLHIFISDQDDLALIKERTMDGAKEKAMFSVDVDVR